jgi:hypothetical protein
VLPREGCLVINVGDALEFWSGGLFKVSRRAILPKTVHVAGNEAIVKCADSHPTIVYPSPRGDAAPPSRDGFEVL